MLIAENSKNFPSLKYINYHGAKNIDSKSSLPDLPAIFEDKFPGITIGN